MTPDVLVRSIDVHLNGAYHVTSPAWPHMREQGYGRVVSHVVGSRHLRQLRPGQLRRRQDGPRRLHQRARRRGRQVQHQGQRHRPGRPDPHDRGHLGGASASGSIRATCRRWSTYLCHESARPRGGSSRSPAAAWPRSSSARVPATPTPSSPPSRSPPTGTQRHRPLGLRRADPDGRRDRGCTSSTYLNRASVAASCFHSAPRSQPCSPPLSSIGLVTHWDGTRCHAHSPRVGTDRKGAMV